jgi:small subunit ribosomal protein S6
MKLENAEKADKEARERRHAAKAKADAEAEALAKANTKTPEESVDNEAEVGEAAEKDQATKTEASVEEGE